MSKPLHDMLKSIPGAHEYGPVFKFNGRPIGAFQHSWEKLKTDIGITDVVFHDFRRSWNKRMSDQGYSQKIIAAGQNHKTLEMSYRYNNVFDDDKLRQKCSSRGLEEAQNFDISKLEKREAEIYEELVKK